MFDVKIDLKFSTQKLLFITSSQNEVWRKIKSNTN